VAQQQLHRAQRDIRHHQPRSVGVAQVVPAEIGNGGLPYTPRIFGLAAPLSFIVPFRFLS